MTLSCVACVRNRAPLIVNTRGNFGSAPNRLVVEVQLCTIAGYGVPEVVVSGIPHHGELLRPNITPEPYAVLICSTGKTSVFVRTVVRKVENGVAVD